MSQFDSLIIGEVAQDTNVDYDGTTVHAVGGAVYYSGFAAANTGHKTAVLPKADTAQVDLAAAFAREDPLGVTAVATLLQHNTSGIISVGEAMLGTIPYWIDRVYKKGHVGVMTRSGSLTNEVTAEIVKGGFGVTTLIGVGGDPVPGTRFAELLPLYEADPDTHAVVIIGELGGTMEEEVAEAMEAKAFTKPLVAFMGGRTAPEGKRMGHAGAIVTGGRGTVKGKTEAIVKAGGKVAKCPSEVGALLKAFLG